MFGLTDATAAAIDLIPEAVWTPAYDTNGGIRGGLGLMPPRWSILSGWPPGMRVIVGK